MNNQELHIVFQLSKTICFEVNYTCHNRKTPSFSTCAMVFNRPKTDFKRCGQCQNDVLEGFNMAKAFYEKWDKLHLQELTPDLYAKMLKELKKLKKVYNFVENSYRYIDFDEVKLLSKMSIAKKEVKCLNCGEKVSVYRENVVKDKFGTHTICPHCKSSFDIV